MLVPLVTPEIVMAVSLLVVFTQLSLVPFTPIHLGTAAQVVGQVTFSLSYVVVIVRSRLASIGPQYEEAARDLGATSWAAIRLVLLPLLMPAILASMLIVFALSIDDFVVTQYMSSTASTTTIPMFLYSNARGGTSTPALNALATILVFTTLLGDRHRLPRLHGAGTPHRVPRGGVSALRELSGMEALMPGDVQLRALTKRYDETIAVDAIDASINAGEFFSLLGPSGCGKTTTLRMIAGFVRPTVGRDPARRRSTSPRCRRTAATSTRCSRTTRCSPTSTCSTTSPSGCAARRWPRARSASACEEALELVELGGMAARRPQQLSGGQQQRVALARALVLRPAVLLLDEPLGALDAKIRKQLRLELKALQEEVGITFVFVTHDQEEALSMSDRVAVMSAGRIEQIGTPGGGLREPGDRVRRRLPRRLEPDGRRRRVDPTHAHDHCTVAWATSGCAPGAATSTAAGPVKIVARPERVRAARARRPTRTTACPGMVERTVYVGASVQVMVRLATGAQLQASIANTGHADGYPQGTPVCVHIPADALRILGDSGAAGPPPAATPDPERPDAETATASACRL